MAKNEARIVISVKGNEILVKATSNAKKLRTEMGKTEKSYDSAAKASSRYNYTMNAGVRQQARNARDFSKLSQTIGSGNNGLVGAYATLAANTFAVTAAFAALSRTANNLKIMDGLISQGARLGVTLTSTANSIKEVTNSTISMADAMRTTAQLAAGGFADKADELAQVAKDAAGALGRDVSDALDRLTRGVTKLEPELLDEIGIMVKLDEATRNYAVELNKSAATLTATEKRQAYMNAVLEEGQRKFGGIGDEVDKYNAYTRLAASATNTFNSTIGALSTALLPLAELLAANPLLIFGAVTMYAASIKDDLIPALGEAVEKQQKLVKLNQEALTERSDKFVQQADEFDKTSKTMPNAGAGKFLKTGSKAVRDLNESIKDGTASARSYQIALDEVDDALIDQNAALSKVTQGSERYHEILSRKEVTLGAAQNIRKLRNAYHETEAAQRALNAQMAGQEVQGPASFWKAMPIIVSESKGQFKELSSTLITANSNMTGMELAGFRAARSLKLVKFGAIATATAVRALGAAFLNMVPIIGQILLVFGLLSAAWKGLKSLFTTDEQKDYNKVLEEYNTILEESSEKVKAYNKLLESASYNTSSQIDAIKLRSNAIKELTDKYEELKIAKEKSDKSSLSDKFSNSFNTDSGNEIIDSAYSKSNLALRNNTNEAKNYRAALDTLAPMIELSNAEQKKYLNNLVQSSKAHYNTAKGVEILEAGIKNLSEQNSSTTTSVSNLQDSYKNLEKSTTAFIQSAIISTPFDKLNSDLNSTVTAVSELEIEFKRGAISAEEFGSALSSISSQSRNLLGPVAVQLQELDGVRSQISGLESLGKDITADQKTQLSNLKEQANVLNSEIGPAIAKRLSVVQNLVRKNQIIARQLKSQLALQKAIYDKVSDQFGESGLAFLAREEHEEKIRAAKAREIGLQIELTSIMQTQAELTLRNLENKKAELEIELALVKVLGTNLTSMVKMATLQSAIASGREEDLRSATKSASEQASEIERLETSIESLDINIRSAKLEMQSLGDSIQALETEKAAILAENLSDAEKAARAAGEEFKLSKKFYEQLNTYSEIIVRTNQAIRDFNSAASNDVSTYVASITEIVDKYEEARTAAIKKLAEEKANLEILKNISAVVSKNNEMSKLQSEASAYQVKAAEAEYENNLKIEQAKLRLLDIESKRELLSAAIYKNSKEGIEWQQEAFELIQKTVEAENSRIQLAYKYRDTLRGTRQILDGLGSTEQSQRNLAVTEASRELQLVKSTFHLRMTSIDAEYALMEAKRIALVEELRSREAILRTLGASGEYLEPINNAISMLSNVDLSSIARNQREGLQIELKVAEASLEQAIAAATSRFSYGGEGAIYEVAQRLRDNREREDVLAEAQNAQMRQLGNRLEIVMGPDKTGIKDLEEGLGEKLDAIPSPMVSIQQDTAAIRNIMENGKPSGADSSGVFDYMSAVGGKGTVTSRFGVNRGTHNHGGVDIGGNNGEPVYATMSGRVTAGAAGAYGNLVKIANGELETRYAHLQRYVVETGQMIQRGDLLGYVGSTGRSTGPHLHYEVRINGKAVDPTKPQRIEVEVASAPSLTMTRATSDQIQSKEAGVASQLAGADERLSTLKSELLEITKLGPIAAHAIDFSNIIDVNGINFYHFRSQLSEDIAAINEKFIFAFQPLRDFAQNIGPEGELVTSLGLGMSSIMQTTASAIDLLNQPIQEGQSQLQFYAQKATAVLGVVSSVMSTISQVTKASSDARIRALEAEISAEQARDGQSSASQQKIAEIEKKKEKVQRKQFETNKKFMMAEAVIATATGIAKALTMGPIVGPIMAAVIGAMGAAQLAVIAGTSYGGGTSSSIKKPEKSKISIGNIGASVNLDRSNPNAGGEIGYLRGTPGRGNNAYNYSTIGSAYGGAINRGYGHRSFLTGEKGPEEITAEEGITVKPIKQKEQKAGDTYVIQATDAQSFERMLKDNPEAIAKGLKRLANSSGKNFMEGVDLKGTKR